MLAKTKDELRKPKAPNYLGPNIYEMTRVFYPELAKEGFLCVGNVDRATHEQGLLSKQPLRPNDPHCKRTKADWWWDFHKDIGAENFTVAKEQKAYNSILTEEPTLCPLFARITHPERLRELKEGL